MAWLSVAVGVLLLLAANGVAAALPNSQARALAHLDWDRSGEVRGVHFLDKGAGGSLVDEAGQELVPWLDAEPRLAVSGDFDADGFDDLLLAEAGRLTLLRGSVSGLRPPLVRDLGGEVTWLVQGEVNRLDGLPDIIVVRRPEEGAADREILIFEHPRGAWHADPETRRLGGEVEAIELEPARGGLKDLHVWTREPTRHWMLEGRDRKLSRGAAARRSVPGPVWRLGDAPPPMMVPAAPERLAIHGRGAEMFVVNDGGDAGGASCPDTCTLRAAAAGASLHPGSTITFSVTAVVPSLTPITVTAPVTILGGGTVTLDGGGVFGGCPLITEAGGSTVDGMIFDGGCLEVKGDASTVTGSYFGMDTASTLLDFASLLVSSDGNTVGGTSLAERNYFGNATLRVLGCANSILGNYSGVNTAGTARLGAFGFVTIAPGDCTGIGPNLVGGTEAGAGNLIAESLFVGGVGTTVQGNTFGVVAGGDALLTGTDGTGIEITGDGALIGGTSAAAGNLISGNSAAFLFAFGIHVKASADGTVIQGNSIGTNAAGTAGIASWRHGIFLDLDSDFPADTTVGGAVAGAGNLISGSSEDGIYLFNVTGGPFTGPVTISGNRIGTNAAVTAAIPNGSNGIRNHRMDNTVIGGSAAAEANIIGGNLASGIDIDSDLVSGVTVLGNSIGTDSTGTVDLGNADHGIFIDDANDSTIGGTGVGEGNTIAFNGDDGIRVNQTTVAQGRFNRLSGNSIYSNVDLGINLTGGNDGQEAPELTTASSTPASATGTLDSTASTEFVLEFFASPACDAGGAGEGERYLGQATVTTDGTGTASFNREIGGVLAVGEVLTATATDPDGNTSEFSDCVTATENTALIFMDGFEAGNITAWSSSTP
ncbi:MAG: hypothetical protein AAGD06_17340 [Acidobacteriota bacterium]